MFTLINTLVFFSLRQPQLGDNVALCPVKKNCLTPATGVDLWDVGQ